MIIQRSLSIDLLKIIGSHLIILHHLVLYSPMAKIVESQLPKLTDFLFIYARLPVWSFLVVAGFLCAQIIDNRTSFNLLHAIGRRCLRLLPLYFISISAVVLVTILLGPFIKDELWISPIPSLIEFLSHLLLIQDLIGQPALSAGAWYVSIDLQLFALTLGLFFLSRYFFTDFRIEMIGLCIFLASLASLYIWSKEEQYEIYAFYFFNAYGLGLIAYLARKSKLCFYFFLLLLMANIIEMGFDLSAKSAVILLTALTLYFVDKGYVITNRTSKIIESASNSSYALFVSHFFVIIIFTGIWNMLDLKGFFVAFTMLIVTWLVATLIATALNFLYARHAYLLPKF